RRVLVDPGHPVRCDLLLGVALARTDGSVRTVLAVARGSASRGWTSVVHRRARRRTRKGSLCRGPGRDRRTATARWRHVPRDQELRGSGAAGTSAAPAGLGLHDSPGWQRLGLWRGASREVIIELQRPDPCPAR